jgi:hypothetical protein
LSWTQLIEAILLYYLDYMISMGPSDCRLLEAEKFLKEAEVIMKYESRTSPYGHLAETVRQGK